jgi:hypothetical protein
MSHRIVCCLWAVVGALFVFTASAWGLDVVQDVMVEYGLADLGLGRWQYDYTVSNVSLGQGVQEFTIYYDYGLYGNLSVATAPPLSQQWNEIILPPDNVLHQGPIFDSLCISSAYAIPAGQAVGGFAVRFDYAGTGRPGAQHFEIVDPVTYATLAEGQTIPEPGAIAMMVFGMAAAARRRKAERK